jgi:hypothetical protein
VGAGGKEEEEDMAVDVIEEDGSDTMKECTLMASVAAYLGSPRVHVI